MDKKLLKAYIRTIVEEEVERLFPKLIKEYVSTANTLVSEAAVTPTEKPKLNRNELAGLLGITRQGDTLRATTGNLGVGSTNIAPPGVPPELAAALNKDYSQMLRDMDKISKNKG
jgi:hypothetical protein